MHYHFNIIGIWNAFDCFILDLDFQQFRVTMLNIIKEKKKKETATMLIIVIHTKRIS